MQRGKSRDFEGNNLVWKLIKDKEGIKAVPEFGKTTRRFQVLNDSKWLPSLLVGLTIASVGGIVYLLIDWGAINAQVQDLHIEKKEVSKKINKIDNRVTTIEAIVPRVEQGIKEMNRKIDRLLTRRSR